MLPLTLFFAVFAIAITRLPNGQGEVLLRFFRALGNAMLVIIGWVLWLAPVGVFALAFGVALRAGGDGAFATLIHYILTVSAMGRHCPADGIFARRSSLAGSGRCVSPRLCCRRRPWPSARKARSPACPPCSTAHGG